MNLSELYGWIVQHPQLAGFVVFLTALAESLAVVGLLVPGVAMMFAAGALIGAGALGFGPVCAYAVAGAIVGDGLSFWLGRHYRGRLLSVWPFSRYPGMVERGMAFFRRHGGSGVLFGRFVGPVRAVIPLVAGMMDMPGRHFLTVNIVSALLWAPAYLLPGMAFGASMELAARITERLVALALVLLAALWSAAWLAKRLYGYCQPRAHGLILALFDFGRGHPWLGRLTIPLVDPSRRDYPGLALWAVLLGGTAFLLCWWWPPGLWPVFLRAWRNPWADYALTVCAGLGGVPALSALGLGVGAILWRAGGRSAAGHWLVGLGFAVGLGWVCRALFPAPRLDAEALNAVVAYGFLAVLLAERVGPGWHWPVYSAAALLVAAVAFARLYAGTGDALAVGFGLALGAAWLAVLGVAYRRHRGAVPPPAGFAWRVALVLAVILAGLWHGHSLAEFARPAAWTAVDAADWLAWRWRDLPSHRARIFGHPDQSLAVQWAAPLVDIRADLVRDGWRVARSWESGTALEVLNPDTDIAALPVLPHFNQAEPDALRMVKPVSGGRWLIARFWPSGWEARGVPIWLGGVAFLEARAWFGLLRFAEERPGGNDAPTLFETGLRTRHGGVVRAAEGGRSVVLIPP
ncbi:LssY C-terminus [Methylomagnum ishizawai]|uniref:LssY C-terminus n=1 Tax=Methylomagnum ishizawai TaxID=1760988 RepID=A0A1Y6CZ23_9GAMM|nr:VTT domain-containing protein [Methylomagnum ishizawai]SMF95617.1 LssY C-terminus [Methylomagnum ishizawai]